MLAPLSMSLGRPPLPLPLGVLEERNVFKLGMEGADILRLSCGNAFVSTIRCLLNAV